MKPESRSSNRHEATWDHHGSYQWTYFSEEVKQRIEYFLSDKLPGLNLDVGGGWYESHPESVVLDLSSVCLEYNQADDKVQFDLDLLGQGLHLPFQDNSFDSATFVSSWQYLRYPDQVTEEMRRVLKPGAEMYIINGQGAGLSECKVNSSRSGDIERYFQDQGYDVIRENIPVDDDLDEFQSVCVAMPQKDIFGEDVSVVRNKEKRIANDAQYSAEPHLFDEEFQTHELRTVAQRLAQISRYPVTAYSHEMLEELEEVSELYFQKTGVAPILLSMSGVQADLDMSIPGESIQIEGITSSSSWAYMGSLEQTVESLRAQLDDPTGRKGTRFSSEVPEHLLNGCKGIQSIQDADRYEYELKNVLSKLAMPGFNSFTRRLQTQMYQILSESVPDLDERILDVQAQTYLSLAHQHKQRRRIDKLIDRKTRILSERVPIVGEGRIDVVDIMTRITTMEIRKK